MKRALFINCILLVFISFTHAQTVETILTHIKIGDGLYVDNSGNIYTASGGLVNGTEIGKYDVQTDTYNPNFAVGFAGPINIARYRDSLFIVSNYDNSTVYSYNLNTKKIKVIATGLDGPAGLVIDSNDNIYISNWGQGPNWAGRTIHKISSTGVVSEYVKSSILYRPQAITINNDGELIVHSQKKLYKINPVDSSLQLWINSPHFIGNMTFRKKDNCIYGASNQGHKIVKITSTGEVSVLSGSTSGYKDGDLSTALFKSPLGIAFSPTEDTLYIGEGLNAIHRLRRIIMPPSVGVDESKNAVIKVYPNPSKDIFRIDRTNNDKVEIAVYDLTGKLIISKTEQTNNLTIDLGQYSIGTYFLELKTKDDIIFEKLIRY